MPTHGKMVPWPTSISATARAAGCDALMIETYKCPKTQDVSWSELYLLIKQSSAMHLGGDETGRAQAND